MGNVKQTREIMKKDELFRIFEITDVLNLPDAAMAVVTGDKDKRDKVYHALLAAVNYDLSYEWFADVYEAELAQRKQNKQDFTPDSVGIIVSALTGDGPATIHEPTAGNGSMLIADWHRRLRQTMPWEYFPSQHVFTCWELSDRSIPLLLLNLSIRGMMGYVYHGDVLEKTVKAKYILLNEHDDALAFSDVFKVHPNAIIVNDNTNGNNIQRPL